MALIPPYNTFDNFDRSIPVYVPEDAVADYKANEYWGDLNIVGNESQLSIGQTNTHAGKEQQKVLLDGQVIVLHNGKQYNMLGQIQ